MMKILILNPHRDAACKLADALQQYGHVALIPEDPSEAWQMLKLHGETVELAILNREDFHGEGQPGVEFLERIKLEHGQAQLPVILISQVWTNDQFAKHQATPFGANAYLKAPYQDSELIRLIEQVVANNLVVERSARIESQSSESGEKTGITLAGGAEVFSIVGVDGEKLGSDTGVGTLGGLAAPDSLAVSGLTIPTATDGSENSQMTRVPPPPPLGAVSSPMASRAGPPPSPSGAGPKGPPPFSKPEGTKAGIGLKPEVGVKSEVAKPKSAGAASPIVTIPEPSTWANRTADLLIPSNTKQTQTPMLNELPEFSLDLANPEMAGASMEIAEVTLGPPSEAISAGAGGSASQAPLESNPPQISSGSDEPQELGLIVEGVGSAPGDSSDESPLLGLGGEGGVSLGEAGDGGVIGELAPIEGLPLSEIPSESEGDSPLSIQSDAGSSAPLFGQESPDSSAAGSPRRPLDAADEELAHELPYLFRRAGDSPPGVSPGTVVFASAPVGNAVVPGGASEAPDSETLKKYLMLREQDVAALSAQLRTAHEQIAALEEGLRAERARASELSHLFGVQESRIKDLERDKELTIEGCQEELQDLRFQLKAKTDKARLIEAKLQDATAEMERLKERVRTDIRKIRVREKELENRLEIMKKDAEALIASRENKIIELKRKLDTLEFNMDLLQDKYVKERENSAQLRERLAKAAQAFRAAGGLLDSQTMPGDEEAESGKIEKVS